MVKRRIRRRIVWLKKFSNARSDSSLFLIAEYTSSTYGSSPWIRANLLIYTTTIISHQITLRTRNPVIAKVALLGAFTENTSRYTLIQAMITTKTARQEISIEYIQCFFIIIRNLVPSDSSFRKSFVSPPMLKDLNNHSNIALKSINIERKINYIGGSIWLLG